MCCVLFPLSLYVTPPKIYGKPATCETTRDNIMKNAPYVGGPAIKCYTVSGCGTNIHLSLPPPNKPLSNCSLPHQPIILPPTHYFSLLACHVSALQMVSRVDCDYYFLFSPPLFLNGAGRAAALVSTIALCTAERVNADSSKWCLFLLFISIFLAKAF